MQGKVLQPFSYDEAHPYAAGQHRGIDIGADAAGETVVAPEAGTISFAGTVPTSGKSVTIETADGYSVTLTHLGSIGVAKGASVSEGVAIGTIGPSGTPEVDVPYLHLGIRQTADANGYVDPLGLLPPLSAGTSTDTSAAASQPSSNAGSSTASGSAPSTSAPAPPATQPASSDPASRPASSSPTIAPTHVQTRDVGHVRERTSHPRAEEQSTSRSHSRSEAQPGRDMTVRTSRPASTRQRPVVETAAPVEPNRLDAGHQIESSAPVTETAQARRPAPGTPLPLILNGTASIVAFCAAFIAARGRRRRRHFADSTAVAPVFQLPLRMPERRPASRAA